MSIIGLDNQGLVWALIAKSNQKAIMIGAAIQQLPSTFCTIFEDTAIVVGSLD